MTVLAILTVMIMMIMTPTILFYTYPNAIYIS